MTLTPVPNRRILITGASGFVGSAALRHVLWNTNWEVVAPVSIRHHGEQSRIMDLPRIYGERLHIVPLDLSMPFSPKDVLPAGWTGVDYVWNIASESHVDRSLTDPVPFIRNNVDLMLNVCEFVRRVQPKVFLHMSTDEVFGPLNQGQAPHTEWEPRKPSNPYSASKSAQEDIAYAYWRSFGIPLVITNTMNLIGPRQHPEKFVPKVIRALTNDETITVHASPDGESGSRCWIGVEDFADAWKWLTDAYDLILQSDRHGGHLTYYPDMPAEPHRFNIVGQKATNLYVAEIIADIMGKTPKIELVDFHTSRPGHDAHYGLDGTKLAKFGWVPPLNLDDRLIRTVHWYQDNPRALEL